jgi:hypothetical protein
VLYCTILYNSHLKLEQRSILRAVRAHADAEVADAIGPREKRGAGAGRLRLLRRPLLLLGQVDRAGWGDGDLRRRRRGGGQAA